MKWSAAQLKSALNKPQGLPPFMLLYGDDAGAVRQQAQAIITASGVDMNDPFAADKIDVTDLQENTGRLAEAAGTISLMGGLRVVLLQGVSGEMGKPQMDATLAAVKGILSTELKEVLVVIPAPHVKKEAALVKAVEKDKVAAAIRFFQENIRDMGAYITQLVQAAGKRIQPDAVALFAEHMGADKEIILREAEKLLLYVGEAENITAEDVAACLSDAPAVNIFKLCDAIGMRDLKTVDAWVEVLLQEGEDANMLLSLAVRHLRRLLHVKEGLSQGKPESEALKGLLPPVTFGKDVFLTQVHKASLTRLRHVVARATLAQYETREYALPPEQHLRRTLLALTA